MGEGRGPQGGRVYARTLSVLRRMLWQADIDGPVLVWQPTNIALLFISSRIPNEQNYGREYITEQRFIYFHIEGCDYCTNGPRQRNGEKDPILETFLIFE